jgi:hypothetical protein
MLLVSFPCAADDSSSKDLSDECDLSGKTDPPLGACPNTTGVALGSTSIGSIALNSIPAGSTGPTIVGPYKGVRIGASSLAVVPIDAVGVDTPHCRWVYNGDADNAYFVPFGLPQDWTAFLNNKPSDVTLYDCALPWFINNAPATTNAPSVNPNFNGADCQGSVDNPNIYGIYNPPQSTIWPAKPIRQDIKCYSGATVVKSLLQFVASYSDAPLNCTLFSNETVSLDDTSSYCTRIMNKLTWATDFQFGPNVHLTAVNGITGEGPSATISATAGDNVVLTWTVPGGGATSCSASGGNNPNDGWTGLKSTDGGSDPFTSLGSGAYSLTCAGANGLTSTATAQINDTGKCGTDNGKTLLALAKLCSLDSTDSDPSSLSGTPTGWNWKCYPVDGGTPAQCSATLQSAQCGTGVTVDPNNGNTAGTLCVYGTGSVVSTTDGTYTCTTGGPGAPSNSVQCAATVLQCVPTGQPVPPGQTQCPTKGCFFQVSGGDEQGAIIVGNDEENMDNMYVPTLVDGIPDSDIVGPGDYPVTSPWGPETYKDTGSFMDPTGYDQTQYPFLYADSDTFDSIALGPKTHVIIYKGQNFTGGTWIDVHGPAYISNMIWYATPPAPREVYTGDCLAVALDGDCTPQNELDIDYGPWPLAPDFPLSTRSLSDTNMQLWGRGSSVQVMCDQ